ncbi:MAG: hypothetical protein GF350_05640 [Chitinivibrionales bacterium]|nr:hypothetical protein [Chitinivibrionales bacterium]
MRKLTIFILGCCVLGYGSVFYIDPQHGDIGNDGSMQNPWSTLQEVIENNKIETRQPVDYPYHWGEPLEPKNSDAPVNAGDTLFLRDGYHGEILISRFYNTDYITIVADSGHTPGIKSLRTLGAGKWIFKNLRISPELVPPYEDIDPLVDIENHGYSGPSREIIVENCYIYSVEDASSWSMNDWDTQSCNAIGVGGAHVIIRNNYCRNVDFGISVGGDSCLVEGNTVENFAGDGLRGLGNDIAFVNNIVKNCYDVNGNHDDGFQSWSRTADGVGQGTVYRIKLIGNVIINYDDPDQPFRGTLQGIGCFDGFFEDWIVENNVIITDHWHGITLSGAVNCRIVNNTVCDLNNQNPGPPWVRIGDHKTRGPSSGCIVRNNLTTSLNSSDVGVTEDHNIIISDPDEFFVDYSSFDLRLKPGCEAVDAGSSDQAPSVDIAGTSRPQQSGYDIGAYEYVDPTQFVKNAAATHALGLKIALTPSKIVVWFPSAMGDRIESARLYDLRGAGIVDLEKPYHNGPSSAEWNISQSLQDKFRAGIYVLEISGPKIKLNSRVSHIE